MKEFIKKWFSDENWKLSTVIAIIGLLSIYTLSISVYYFGKNEILFGISDKYVTTKENSIKDIVDTATIHNKFNNNIKSTGITSINDTITKQLSIGYPTKHIIEKTEKESFELGDIGDFIGGYFGFLIGVIGALLTFLAFYIQYKANKEVQKQFRLQQFETQFHKMIDVYLNNKDKFSIVGYKNPKNKKVLIKGKNLKEKCDFKNNNLFTYLTKNNKIEFIDYVTRDHIVFQKFLVELKVVYRVFLEAYKEIYYKSEKALSGDEKKKIFTEAYKLFFNGLNKYEKDRTEITEYKKLALLSLKKIRGKHRKDGSKKFVDFYIGKEGENKTLWVKLNYEPFKGYLHFLPQYYRNLYSIVKFVVNQNKDINLTEQQKEDYLKILRSTMSDYEQTMLFYNWYSGTAKEWENNTNHFFKNYKMIHNLKKITLIDDDIDIYSILKIPKQEQDHFFEKYIN